MIMKDCISKDIKLGYILQIMTANSSNMVSPILITITFNIMLPNPVIMRLSQMLKLFIYFYLISLFSLQHIFQINLKMNLFEFRF